MSRTGKQLYSIYDYPNKENMQSDNDYSSYTDLRKVEPITFSPPGHQQNLTPVTLNANQRNSHDD